MSESPPTGNKIVAKRVRTDSDEDDNRKVAKNVNNQMDTTASTILEWLNRDVLHIVLDYMSINDILGSITVSRKWRSELLEYLKGSHYCFEHYYLPRLHFVPRLLGLVSTTDWSKNRSTPFDMSHGDFQQFLTKIRNFGPAIVTIVLDCLNENSLRTIVQNCPNLKTLMVVKENIMWKPDIILISICAKYNKKILVGLQEHHAHEPRNLLAPAEQCGLLSFTEDVQQCLKDLQLQRIMFIDCKTMTEKYIGEFIKYDSVEELVISRNTSVEGHCLSYLSQKEEKNLKSIRLVGCAVKFHYLDSVADHLINLTKLDLSNNSLELMENVHRFLDRTPNLEYLFMNCYAKIDGGHEFAESLRRLSCLKHLSLCWNDNLCDEWLQAVAQGCPGLLTVDIETKNSGFRSGRATVTATGILALCRAASELTHLGVAGIGTVTDATVATIVNTCPKIKSVDLRGCARVAENDGVLTGVAAPQRQDRPLCLRLARTAAHRHQAQAPKGLTFDFVDAPRLFRLV